MALRLDFYSEDISMVKTMPIPPPGFDELSVEEKLDYVQSLWDRLAATPEKVSVPDWHKQIVNERLAAYRANLYEGRSWDQVRKSIQRKLSITSPNRH
jgi:putative addiction module component (TIGR02574 family)